MAQRPAPVSPWADPEAWNTVQQNLLTAITTVVECSDRLSQSPTLEPERYADLQIIYQSSQNLLTLVEELIPQGSSSDRYDRSSNLSGD